jgi:hypothetical protein
MTNESNLRILLAHFSNNDQARQACRELENLGISSDQIVINADETMAAATGPSRLLNPETEGQEKSTFAKWWDSLFGSDNEEKHAERKGYESALARGSILLRAVVPGVLEDSAVRVLNGAGATDVDQAGTAGGVRAYDHPAAPSASTGEIRATGMSPRPITPGVQSNGAGTAGEGTLAGTSTASSTLDSFTPEYRKHFETQAGGEDEEFGGNKSGDRLGAGGRP